ncbi:hypothetical protein C8Q75DRAFT_98359 [Abortiporus biennis]|nr:hypothetical protein C8Q75DRAFT_98359 [Abortiporus biennis]
MTAPCILVFFRSFLGHCYFSLMNAWMWCVSPTTKKKVPDLLNALVNHLTSPRRGNNTSNLWSPWNAVSEACVSRINVNLKQFPDA